MKLNKRLALAVSSLLLTTAICMIAWQQARQPQRCPTGLMAHGARCCGVGQSFDGERCVGPARSCAANMNASAQGCTSRQQRVSLSGGELLLAPSDWEAQGRVRPRRVQVAAFTIDSHEATERNYGECVRARRCPAVPTRGEDELPQTHLNADEAAQFCRWRGGRLPSHDEHAFAVMGSTHRRYPWGQTGAVCRRVSFGLERGPCGRDGKGPDLVGSRPDGVSPEGLYDLVGNVAEWTRAVGGHHEVRGGSWRTIAASELRAWSAVMLSPHRRMDDVGVRCAYDP